MNNNLSKKSGSNLKKDRNGYLDMLRGVTILIVVFAHAIQSCNGMAADNAVHVIIQTFQMPLLMIISGYSSGFSEPVKNIADALKKKVLRLLVPYLVWVQIHYLLTSLAAGTYNITINLMRFLNSEFWFLRILFLLYLIYYLFCFLVKVIKAKSFIKISVGVCVCVITVLVIHYIPGCESLLTYSVFFFFGNILYKFRKTFSNKYVLNLHYIFIVVFAVSILLYMFVDNSLIKNLIDKSMAFSGSAFVASISYIIYRFIPVNRIKSFLKKTGENTLPIYAFHWCVFFSLYINPMIILADRGWNIYVCALLTCVLWMTLCNIFIFVAEKTNITSMLLLGSKKRK